MGFEEGKERSQEAGVARALSQFGSFDAAEGKKSLAKSLIPQRRGQCLQRKGAGIVCPVVSHDLI